MKNKGPIGIFDSGFGGLTVLKEILHTLPEYDYLYLGDNARAPYGNRSFQTVYEFTLECVQHLFERGCSLVILACNTASAKALRNIQQSYLPEYAPDKRVLGVIRPTAEIIGNYTETGEVGIFGTRGTVNSESYLIEIAKFFPDLKVYQEACPIWVPLIENNLIYQPGTEQFVKMHLNRLLHQSARIDTLLLACTHYPILEPIIRKALNGKKMRIISQGPIVAESLLNYLKRHPELDALCSKNGDRHYMTTDSVEEFNEKGTAFLGQKIKSEFLHF